MEAFRAVASPSSKIGIVIDVWKRYAKYPTEQNLAAVCDEDERNWKFYTDPVLGGAYSDYILSALAREGTLMEIQEGDLARIHAPIDFFGLNIYDRVLINKGKRGAKKLLAGGNQQETRGGFDPHVIRDVVRMLREMYSLTLPILITENGKGTYVHEGSRGGMIRDKKRVDYFKAVLAEVERANEEGLNIAGYFAWSLMDNIEWCAGTMIKYGLIHTNFKTFETKWKQSAYFYRDYIASHHTDQ